MVAKSYFVEICGKSFFDNSDLVIHMQSHTGGKPFCWEVCGESSFRNSRLVGHKWTNTREKPFHCDVGNHLSLIVS
ncbi:---NA--- [Octopus vulgaris]|uniref:---NA n=1 Tax=Octopus vulgaris TaxID=6645 RepID=A0AA36BQM5_OCTVU|nr:---NA--- [Octopus vulgaris]